MGDPICEKGQKYTFRVNPPASKLGTASIDFVNDVVIPALKIPKEKLKIAILQEDGLYGQMTGNAAKDRIASLKMNLVSYLVYNYKTIDLSTEITKTKATEPDVVIQFSAGPDTFLFWRQAKAANFNMKCFIGQGPFGMVDFLNAFPKDYEYVIDVGNPMERLEPSLLKPDAASDLKEFRDRYRKLHGVTPGGPASQAFAGTWLLYKHVIPLAKSFDPEAIRNAILSIDFKEKDLVTGFGAKFAPPDHSIAGANLRAFPAIMQWKDKNLYIVYPKEIASKQAELPMPRWEDRK
jgi:branched-chain amino acid transport system substrate-binding protein